jgi:hypothetical protein
MTVIVRGLSSEDGSRQLQKRAFFQIFLTIEKIIFNFDDSDDTILLSRIYVLQQNHTYQNFCEICQQEIINLRTRYQE